MITWGTLAGIDKRLRELLAALDVHRGYLLGKYLVAPRRRQVPKLGFEPGLLVKGGGPYISELYRQKCSHDIQVF